MLHSTSPEYTMFFKTGDEWQVEPFEALQERSRVFRLGRISHDTTAFKPLSASFFAPVFAIDCQTLQA